MCGLVGVVNKLQNGMYKPQQEMFSALLLIDYLRGNDSTGVFAVHNDGDILLAKEASDPIRFMGSKEYEEIMKKTWSRGNALIGHNRKATRGNVNDENAHPFVVDDKIVLVHNGTMFGDHKKIADVEVDSHAIAHAIHEKGDVEEALSSFDAAYALIWFDVEKKTLNFIRNTHRPLWWMETYDSFVWASERGMLDFVVDKFNLRQSLKSQPTELTPDVHQVFTLSNNSWASSNSKVDIVRPVAQTAVVPFRPQQQWTGRQPQHRYQEYGYYPGMYDDDADAFDTTQAGVFDDATPTRTTKDPERQRQVPAIEQPRDVKTTTEFEATLARKMNKVVTLDEWNKQIIQYYPEGKRVTAQAFDYCYANQRDTVGGYFLYLALCEDSDVIVRHYFESRFTTEERIVQIASGEYIYTYTVGRKRWAPLSGTVSGNGHQPGYCIIEGEQPVLVEGGGMTNPLASALTQ